MKSFYNNNNNNNNNNNYIIIVITKQLATNNNINRPHVLNWWRFHFFYQSQIIKKSDSQYGIGT